MAKYGSNYWLDRSGFVFVLELSWTIEFLTDELRFPTHPFWYAIFSETAPLSETFSLCILSVISFLFKGKVHTFVGKCPRVGGSN